MPKSWSPSKRDFAKAWTIHKKGKSNGGTQLDIQKTLNISKSLYYTHRKAFTKYFRTMSRKPTGKPRGQPEGNRKLSLEDIDLELLTKLVAVGYTLNDIAGVLGINDDTLRRYRREFPEVKDAIDNTMAKQNSDIVGAMLARAKGYEHDATHFSAYEGNVTETDYKKHYPPDIEAGRLLLANRIGFIRDAQPKGTNNKGRILEALDNMMSEDDKEQ